MYNGGGVESSQRVKLGLVYDLSCAVSVLRSSTVICFKVFCV